jgi:hypothetical protein
MVTIAAALMSLSVAAHNPGKDPDSYCVKNKNGKMIVTHNGRELTETIKLKDGTKVKPNGTIVFTDGKRVKLERGECVDENNLDHFASRKGELEKKVDKAENKIEKKADRVGDKIENKTDRSERKAENAEDKAEKKMDKIDRKADKKVDKAEKKIDRTKEKAREKKEDVKDDLNDDLDK